MMACCGADVGKRAIDEFPQADQAAAENRAGAAVYGDGPPFDDLERHQGGVQAISNLVGDLSESFELLAESRFGSNTRVLGDGVRNGRVQTAVQDVEFLRRDRRVL